MTRPESDGSTHDEGPGWDRLRRAPGESDDRGSGRPTHAGGRRSRGSGRSRRGFGHRSRSSRRGAVTGLAACLVLLLLLPTLQDAHARALDGPPMDRTGAADRDGTAPAGEAAVQEVVAGRVLDGEAGEPVAGAQVTVAGTGLGTLTGPDGRFRIEGVEGNRVELEVRRIGYRARAKTVEAGRTDIEVVLERGALELDEIRVTGTAEGTRSRAIGNPIARVDVGDRLDVVPAQTIQDFLSSEVAGLRAFTAPGDVGTGSAARVRGSSSLTLSSVPLVYLDGTRIDNDPRARTGRGGVATNRLNDLNPDEIQSIEVIRGPAAATLFGTEASSGVLVITTHRGRSGEPTLEATVRQGANWLPDPTGVWPAAYDRDPETGELRRFHPVEQDEALGISPFQAGHLQSYRLGVDGGSDLLRYHTSAELGRNEGIVDWNWQERFHARSNIDVTPADDLEIGTSLGYARTRTHLTGVVGELPWNIVWTLPAFADTDTRGYRGHPPEARRTVEPAEAVDRITGSGTLRHRPTDWLTYRFTAGTDVGHVSNSLLVPRHPDGRGYFFGAQSLGHKEVEDVRTGNLTLDLAATASLPVGERFSAETSAGLQYYRKRVESSHVVGREFPVPGRSTVAAAADREASEDLLENKTVGLYVQQEVGWRDRAFLTGAVRGDDNSAFGAEYDFVLYPKLSATWVVSEEPFWGFDGVSELKLRAAWGQAGRQPDIFDAQRLYQPITAHGDNPGLTPNAVGNPELRPEVGEELEVGFDAALLAGRGRVELTLYRQRVRDAIVGRPVAWSSGFPGVQFVNLGEIRNRGLEVDLHGVLLERTGLVWDAGLNLSLNRNRVEDLGGLPPISLPGLGQQRHMEGYPAAGVWDYRVVSAEFDGDGAVVNALCEAPEGGVVSCDEAERVYRGPSLPTWEGSASTGLRLGERARVHALVDFLGGHKKVSGDVWGSHIVFRNSRAIHERTDPVLAAYDEVLGVGSPTGIMDAGFARLREVGLSYQVPEAWAGRVGARRASLSVSARNLPVLWAAQEEVFGRRTVDVELANQSGEFGGYYQTRMPPFRTVVTSLRLTF